MTRSDYFVKSQCSINISNVKSVKDSTTDFTRIWLKLVRLFSSGRIQLRNPPLGEEPLFGEEEEQIRVTSVLTFFYSRLSSVYYPALSRITRFTMIRYDQIDCVVYLFLLLYFIFKFRLGSKLSRESGSIARFLDGSSKVSRFYTNLNMLE